MSASTSRFAGSDPSSRVRSAVPTSRNVRLGICGRHAQEQPDIAVWVGSDRDDVDLGLPDRRSKGMLVDPERDELDVRRLAVRRQPVAQLRGLVLAVREDCGRGGERPRIQASHALRAKSCEPLRKPDCDVDERRPDSARPVEQHERDPDGVDGREDDAGAVRAAERREHRLEVAAVAPRPLQCRLHRRAGRARPRRRRPRALEVVVHRPAPRSASWSRPKKRYRSADPTGAASARRRCGESRKT